MSIVPLGTGTYNDRHESTLDVEWMAAIAPSVNIVQAAIPTNSFADFVKLYSYFVNKRSNINIVSTSWGA